MDTSLDDRLGRHDEILRAHRERFEAHKRWLQGQRSTPSFAPQSMMGDGMEPTENISSPHRRGGGMGSVPLGPKTPPRIAATVYDDLISKGKMYQQHKEELRASAIEKEITDITKNAKKSENRKPFQPVVSALAKELKREGRFEDRFKKLEFERRQVEEFTKSKYVKKEFDDQTYSFKPKISKKGRRATSRTSTAEGNIAWQQKKEEELENLRTKKIISEMAEVREIPEIDERSARLADKKKKKEGMAGYNLIDTMLERDRLSRLAAWERQQQEIRNSQPGNPKITAHAANLPRDGDIYERLYTNAFESEAKRSALVTNKINQDGQQCAHSPRITTNATSLVRDRPVEDDLLQRHEYSKAAQEEHIRMMIERERDLHTPAINPVSDEIAARLPETSRERLYKPKNQYYDPTEYPFQPMLNPTSVEIDAGKSTMSTSRVSNDNSQRHQERIEQLYQREMHRQERLDQMRVEEEQKMMAECTFQPRTHQDHGMEPTPLRVYHRVTQWALRRDQKVREQRDEKDRQEVADCTFRPMSANASPLPSEHSNSLYGGDGKAWGYEEYIERQRDARKRHQDKSTKGWVTGNNWRNEVTVPQEFHLGRRDKPIKSLQKPLEAPIQQPSTSRFSGMGPGPGSQEFEAYMSTTSTLQGAAGLPPKGAFSTRTTSGFVDR